MVPIYKGGDRSAVTNYRAISFTPVVCKQLGHVIVGYSRQDWDKNDWIYEKQHGFRPEYSCESQVITVCQDIADCLDEAVGIDAIIIDFSKVFDLVPHNRLLMKLEASGVDLRIVKWVKGIPSRSYTKGQIRRVTIQGSQSKLRCVASVV